MSPLLSRILQINSRNPPNIQNHCSYWPQLSMPTQLNLSACCLQQFLMWGYAWDLDVEAGSICLRDSGLCVIWPTKSLLAYCDIFWETMFAFCLLFISRWCHNISTIPNSWGHLPNPRDQVPIHDANNLIHEAIYLTIDTIYLIHEASYLLHEANYLNYETNYLIHYYFSA
jgi:hypothetical protein